MSKVLKAITFLAFMAFAISASMLDGTYWVQALTVTIVSFGWLMLFAFANSKG